MANTFDRVPEAAFRLGGVLVEPDTRRVVGPKTVTHLTPKAVAVLLALADADGAVVPKSAVLEKVWPDTAVGDHVVANTVWQLREALGDTDAAVIVTVPRRGYRLGVPAITETSGALVEPVLAVLPLDNLTGDPEQLWLADGVTEALIDELARHQGVRVIARASTAHYREHPAPPWQVATDLGIDHLVTGAVHRGRERVRVTVQLVDPSIGTQIWSTSRERTVAELPFIHADLAVEIAREIGMSVAPDRDSGGSPTAPQPGAVESQLRGRLLVRGPRFEDIEGGISQLEQTIARWPSFAPPHADLGRGYYTLARWGRAPGRPLLEKAQRALRRATDLAPDLLEARVIGATVDAALAWDARRAVFRLAREVDGRPSNPEALDALARCIAAIGWPEEAIRIETRALEADPLSPTLNTALGFFHRIAGQHSEAMARFQRTLELAPGWTVAKIELARTFLAAGWGEKAVCTLAEVEPCWAEFLDDALGDRQNRVRERLDCWIAAEDRYEAPYWLAERCMWAGEHERAIDCLERAYVERQVQLMFVGVEPVFFPLAHLARFQDLLARF